MYLRRALISNSGPLKNLELNFAFQDSGRPKPVLLVGSNGSGTTVFLSIIADAIFEAASTHFHDVLPTRSNGRAWFRFVGPRNVTVGAEGNLSILDFDVNGTNRYYLEKSGKASHQAVTDFIKVRRDNLLSWSEGRDENVKLFDISSEESKDTFQQGCYAFFPSSRSEVPYWLNRESLPEPTFDFQPRIANVLKKPIYIEKALDEFLQWLLSLMADARAQIAPNAAGQESGWHFVGNPSQATAAATALQAANQVLKLILDDDAVYFGWLGRRSSDKIAVGRHGQLYLPNLSALSAGQSLLLGLFGTIMRYGDMAERGEGLDPEGVTGVVLINEVDAHMHINLQYHVIPKLIMMFPRVQFIISNHSPLLVLGLEQKMGIGNFQLLEMPEGTEIDAERYSEFGNAMDAVRSSRAFTREILDAVRQDGKPVIYVEGETDEPYIRRAAELLGRHDILERGDINWIGSKDEKGQGFNTGGDALKHACSLLRANPRMMKRPVLLLYDNDSNAPESDFDNFSTRRIPLLKSNIKRGTGIENLLAETAILDEYFSEKKKTKASGDIVITRSLDKAALCAHLCQDGTAEDFANFAGILDIIDEFLMRCEGASSV